MRGVTPPAQYVFMAWCLVKHDDNFTLIVLGEVLIAVCMEVTWSILLRTLFPRACGVYSSLGAGTAFVNQPTNLHGLTFLEVEADLHALTFHDGSVDRKTSRLNLPL